ncbi:MAG TPA: energy-coupling factor transporter transmembrane component T [Anaerolineales bacterium]|nr:energy-coupling factor transporter transmembrane component T [Anaerolineales bacterium]
MQLKQTISYRSGLIRMGTFGHLAVFIWLLSITMIVPQRNLFVSVMLCLLVVAGLYPAVFKRALTLRFVLLGLVLMLPPIFLMGEADRTLLGLTYSSEGLKIGIQAIARFWVVLLAVFGFTQSVDIPSLAGIMERFGLQGLGFSIGVALNLVPSLLDAARKSWYSFKMRGGFRKQWFRGIQLYLVVVITNALRQAEEIALAAEARAFSPEKARSMAVQHARVDWFVCPVCLLSFIVILVWM